MSVLQTQELSFSYEKNTAVLKKINLSFDAGRMYAILGPSGAGKSTLLSLLGGLDAPTGGKILYEGEDIEIKGLEYHRKNNVAFIFQNYNLIDYLTALENVMISAKQDPHTILLRVGLTSDEAKRNILKLSGGQQQRVAIARALVSNAKIILADEPTGNLDENTAALISELLKKSASEYNKCVIVVTHSNEVAAQADVLYQMCRNNYEMNLEKDNII